jgi:catechol-2,3-dioxygenase
MKRALDSNQLVRPAKFAHVVLRVTDLAASVAWYRTVVGMEPVFENDFVAFMTYDEEHHRIALIATPQQEPAPRGAAGLDHFAYSLETLEDLLGTYLRLEKAGIRPAWSINHGPTTSLYYSDPDGNRVEFQVDNFESEQDLKGWMDGQAFAANPIGVEFDPAKLIERFEAGDPISELKRQGAA